MADTPIPAPPPPASPDPAPAPGPASTPVAARPPAPSKSSWFSLGDNEGELLHGSRAFQKLALPLIFLVFLGMSMPYLRADLWFDEVITLGDYAQQAELGSIFTRYHDPNNHILFSALLWCWVNFIHSTSEEALRLPGILTAALTLHLLYFQGRRLFDAPAGFFLAVLMAFSPIYLQFATEVRGYALSILLGTAATIGALYLAQERLGRGVAFWLPAVLLLPGVLPSNLAVSFSLWLFLLLWWGRQGKLLRHLGLLLVLGLTAVAGMLWYLPVAPQFVKAMRTTVGWETEGLLANHWPTWVANHPGPLVAAHWVLVVAAHAGLFMLACYALTRGRDLGRQRAGARLSSLYEALPLLALCCLVPLLLVACVRAPFPRTFLAYLAPLSFCGLWFFRPGLVVRNTHFLLLTFFLLANTLVVTRLSAFFNAADLQNGVYRQNLLQQFYAQSRDLSTTLRILRQTPYLTPYTFVYTDFHFYPALRLYAGSVGMADEQCLCLAGKTKRFNPPRSAAFYARYPQLILAYNGEQAQAAYRATLGPTVRLHPLPINTPLTVYMVMPEGHDPFAEPPASPPPPTAPPRPRPPNLEPPI